MTEVSKEEKDIFKKMLSKAYDYNIHNPDTSIISENISEEMPPNDEFSNIDLNSAFSSLMGNSTPTVHNVTEKKIIPIHETKSGYKVGDWEVDIERHKTSNKPVMYNILHSQTKSSIASVRVFEAADIIAKSLNEGLSITSKPMVEILSLAEVYESHYNDCKRFKHLMNKYIKEGDQKKTDIYEARYQKAYSELIHIKNQLKRKSL